MVGYRKKVVRTNLRNSFPQKSDAEIEALAKKFYRYFCDLLLETFKTLTISEKAMLQHCKPTEEAKRLMASFAAQNESVLLVLGHKGNWEWGANTVALSFAHELFIIYHPLSNPYFDKLMYGMRTRFGAKMIRMKDTFKEMARQRNSLTATAFVADQAPSPSHAHWMQFLNQDTPVFLGTEKIAKKLNRTVVYLSIEKIKRGYYTLNIDSNFVMRPTQYPHAGDLTEAHTKRLEADIAAQPETWLWTHRRWKHERN